MFPYLEIQMTIILYKFMIAWLISASFIPNPNKSETVQSAPTESASGIS
jgi:hypothetical protein